MGGDFSIAAFVASPSFDGPRVGICLDRTLVGIPLDFDGVLPDCALFWAI
jgi:hypothetical protein